MPLVIDSYRYVAWCSWPVRTGLQGACWAAVKWRMAVVYASYCLWMEGQAINSLWPSHIQGSVEQWVNGNSQSMSVLRMANGNGEWFNKFYEKQCHVWCFYSPFHISSTLLIDYLQKWSSFTRPLRPCSNLSTCNFASPTLNFRLIRVVCFLSRV